MYESIYFLPGLQAMFFPFLYYSLLFVIECSMHCFLILSRTFLGENLITIYWASLNQKFRIGNVPNSGNFSASKPHTWKMSHPSSGNQSQSKQRCPKNTAYNYLQSTWIRNPWNTNKFPGWTSDSFLEHLIMGITRISRSETWNASGLNRFE